jgi:hypothetical protein
MMGNDRYGHGGAAGILAAVLIVVGFGFVIPTPPDLDSSARVFADYYVDHQDGIRAGFTIASVAMIFFLWFLGSLRVALGDAEGGAGRLSSVAFGAGLVGVAALTVGLGAGETAAFRPTDLDPGVTRALNDVFAVIAAPAASALAVMFGATAVIGFRHGGLPGWATWCSAIAAVGQLPAYGAALTTSGAFAGDGVLGLFVPVLTFTIAVVALGVALMRAPEPPSAVR